jgi:TPP-dependent pyruvate/acetoin dehydrogenase alpha subunit
VPQSRDLGAYLAAGLQPKRILAQHFGRESGFTGGRDGALSVGDLTHGLLPTLPFAGVNIPIAAGAALAMKSSTSIALTFLDESYISSGDAHEGLNFAAVLHLPLVVVVEGSSPDLGSATPRSVNIADRAAAYGISAQRADGCDPLAVFFAAGEAVARARAGLGPAIVHASVVESRADGTLSSSRLDGLSRLAAFLKDEGIMSEEQRADLERAIEQDAALAADWAEAERMPSETTSQVNYAQADAVSARPARHGR